MRALTVGSFKSYGAPQAVPLAPLTVLIGANASGKSNFIEAVQLMSWLAHSHRLGDLAHALREHELLVRGRPQDLLSSGTDVTLGCEVDGLILDWTIRIDGRGPRIVSERLDVPPERSEFPLYRVEHPADEHGSELVVAYNNFARGGRKPQITCVDQQAVFTQLLTPARFEHPRSQQEIPASCQRVAEALGGIVFLEPRPAEMRQYSYRDETALYANGSNVSAVLAKLHDDGRSDEVLSFVRSLPEQNIRSIDFLRGPRNDVMVQLVETFGGRDQPRDAAVLSDGSLRVLAVAAAVLTVRPGALVVIEEIDNGVHPSRAKLLMEALHAAAKSRNVQLLVTTHNPALLDAIPPAAIADTVACYRDPSTGESRMQRLGDLEDFVAVTARGPLGMLATSGALEHFLKVRKSAEERRIQGQQVMDLFRKHG